MAWLSFKAKPKVPPTYKEVGGTLSQWNGKAPLTVACANPLFILFIIPFDSVVKYGRNGKHFNHLRIWRDK